MVLIEETVDGACGFVPFDELHSGPSAQPLENRVERGESLGPVGGRQTPIGPVSLHVRQQVEAAEMACGYNQAIGPALQQVLKTHELNAS